MIASYLHLGRTAWERIVAAGFDATHIEHTELGVRVELATAWFKVLPGLMRLEPFVPDRHAARDALRVASFGKPSLEFDGNAAIGHVHSYVLTAKQHGFQLDVEITEPVPLRIDRSGCWKKHPPSKRRHMKSWRFADPAEKRRYAGGSRWDRHPDAGRRSRLGRATVVQCVYVYAQESVDTEELLMDWNHKWWSRVERALWGSE